ncbi:MAG: hypothetical protein ABJB69_07365 [Spartobacteria bacterium]
MRKQLATAEEGEDKAGIVELSQRIVAIAPNESAIWEKIVQALYDAEDFDRCRQTLDAWEKAAKQSTAVIENFRGAIAFKKKDFGTAQRHLLAALAKKPTPVVAASVYDDLAEVCAAQSRWLDHENYRAKAILAEDTIGRRISHAAALLRLHQWDAAYAEMAKANKKDASDADVKEWLPQFERLQKYLPRIKATDARIAKKPNDVIALLDRARLFTLAERPLLALDDCERAMKVDPASMRARIQTGEALQDVARPEDAAKLQVSQKLERGDDKHVREGALDALAEQDALILKDPDNAAPLAARAKILRGLQQFTLALSDAQAALAIDEESVAAYFESAHDLDELGNGREALECAIKVTELNQDDAVAWYYRGVLEAQRADFAAAIESQTHSLSLRESLVALRERENCARRIGKIDNADADLKRIHELELPKP